MEFKHFGTDGIRGIVGDVITTDYVIKVAKATVAAIQPKKVVIGWDTRSSCDFIVNIMAGILAGSGVAVVKVGMVPTTALSYITYKTGADLGIMISASHNDYTYNGIKFFDSCGNKLGDEAAGKIDALIDSFGDGFDNAETAKPVGTITYDATAINIWQKFLISKFNKVKRKGKIAIDCAYGSGAGCAKDVLKALGLRATLFNTKYDGLNINANCGAINPETLTKLMMGSQFAVGFSFDGDADRCVVFDENGDAVHGDVLIYLLAKHLGAKKIASTIMFNLGVEKDLQKMGIEVIRTAVGDRFVKQAIVEHNLKIGGETSGHIIIPKIWKGGDGLIVALMVLEIMQKSGRKLSELCSGINITTQINKKVPVTLEQKKQTKSKIEMQGDYKVIVRPSGTENIIRVTVEGACKQQCERIAQAEVAKLSL